MKKLNVVNGKAAPQRLGPIQPQGEVANRVVQRGSQFWRSLQGRSESPQEKDAHADTWKEFPEGAEELEIPADGVSRRNFFGLIGSGAALAGVSMTTTGCIRKPQENILPFKTRPEDVIPGKPMFYASAFALGGSVEGVVVESHDGRPIKLEGNGNHSGSGGATSLYAQASILDLYDPDRSRMPMKDGEISDWSAARAGLTTLLDGKSKAKGAGLAFVVRDMPSPTNRSLLASMKQRYPQARFFDGDSLRNAQSVAVAEMLAGDGARFRYSLEGAKVIASFDADFLGSNFEDGNRLSREWSGTRQVVGPTDPMSRLYVFEPHLSNTGMMADHRARIRGSQVGDALIALAKALMGGKYDAVKAPPGFSVDALPAVQLDEGTQAVVEVLAQDLAEAVENDRCKEAAAAAAAGAKPSRYRPLCKSAVMVGERQPMWVHALAAAINSAVRNTGTMVRWRFDRSAVPLETLTALSEGLGKDIDTVVCVDTNPAYDGLSDHGLAEKLTAATTIHLGLYRDETGALANWHLPISHFLEAWGDAESTDGTIAIVQPLIDPLHDTYSDTELLHLIATGKLDRGSAVLKKFWKGQLGPSFSDKTWRRWLHDGVVTGAPREVNIPPLSNWEKIPPAVTEGRKPVEGMEINFHLDPTLADGRYGNNAWLQELPHPVSKLAWDNAAYVSPGTANKLGVANEDLVTVTVTGGGSMELPIFIMPGQATDTVSINIGSGRTVVRWDGDEGVVSKGAGFNANVARSSASAWIAGGTLAKASGTYALANTQDYGSLKPPAYLNNFKERPIVLEATTEEFSAEPNFVEKANLMDEERLRHLWEPPKLTGKQQWGMSVDLNTCTGCLSCVVACQAENNIAVVGKEQVINGRELHWIRLDRYYRAVDPKTRHDESWENIDDVEAAIQPMFCQHCESAPCESVCPVAATVHSPEGLNDMVYNRCIGTRYCSNNCPYKVRRYNFFNYNLGLRPGDWKIYRQDDQTRKGLEREDAWLRQMQKNPDVTVRFRGIMEKCTYCVQRINAQKIEAHVAGKDVVEDGKILTACQQVCPTGAMVFGDIHDPDSAVSKAKRSPRNYAVLRDLNTQPRTTYLARIRNPHPTLGAIRKKAEQDFAASQGETPASSDAAAAEQTGEHH
ncbi:MAG: Fe-S-cluster-containing hydrogenase [Nannocystales bacterium]